MDLVEGIKTRKSVRAFLPRPVPRETLEQILELAACAPSWSNTQPWEVTVIGGDVMKELQNTIFQMANSGVTPSPDIPFPRFPEPYVTRSRNLGSQLYTVLGINREDREARLAWARQGNRLFDAPNGFIFDIDRQLGPYSILDLGLFCENLMLAAAGFGLGTCALAAGVLYPAVLRSLLGIPEAKQIVFSMAIGYPDWQHPVNKLTSQRDPVASFTRWCGF